MNRVSLLSHLLILKPRCCPSHCLDLLFQTEHVWTGHWLLPKEQPLSAVARHWKRPPSSLSSPGMQGWSQTLQHQERPSALLQGDKWTADRNTPPNPSLQRFACIQLWHCQSKADKVQAEADEAILLLLRFKAKRTECAVVRQVLCSLSYCSSAFLQWPVWINFFQRQREMSPQHFRSHQGLLKRH